MAEERADSLIIGFTADLTQARRDYEAFKREVESNPLRAGGGGSSAGGAMPATGRSFSGAESLLGAPGAGATSVAAQASLGRAVGGSGFGPAVGPLPTSGVNTVYGQVSSSVSMAEVTSARLGTLPSLGTPRIPLTNSESRRQQQAAARYELYSRRAQEAGIDPGLLRSSEEFATPMGRMLAGEDIRAGRAAQRYEMDQERNAPLLGPGGGPVEVDDFTRSQLRGGGGGLSGSDFSRGRASLRTLNPTQGFLERNFGPGSHASAFGGIGSSVVLRSAAVAAEVLNEVNTVIGNNQRQGDIQRFDSLDSAADEAASNQRGTVGLGRTIGGIANQFIDVGDRSTSAVFGRRALRYSQNLRQRIFGGDRFVDDASVADATDISRRQRGNTLTTQSLRNATDIEASTGLIGSEGFGAEVGQARNSARIQLRGLRQQAIDNPFANNSREQGAVTGELNRKLADVGTQIAQAVRSSLGNSRTAALGASNNPYAAGLLQLDTEAQDRQFTLDRTTRGLSPGAASILQNAENTQTATARAAFEANYSRPVTIGTFGIRSATAVSQLSRRGDNYGAEVLGIRSETQQTLAGLPGYEAYQRDPNSVGAADRDRINAVIAAGQERLAGAAQTRGGALRGAGFDLQAGAAALNGDRIGASIAGIEGGFSRQYPGQSLSEIDVKAADNQRKQQEALIRQQGRYERLDTQLSLDTSGRSLTRLLARDTVGASASDTAGASIQNIRNLYRNANTRDLAEQARTQGLQQEDLIGQNYALAFRGQQIDLQNILPDFRRDGQDPAKIFGEIAEEKSRIAGADGGKGQADDGSVKLDDATQRNLANLFAAALVAQLAK